LPVVHRPSRRSCGRIGEPVMVRGFHRLSIVGRKREMKPAADFPSLGLWAGCTKGAW
jgi:hypothetical protein